MSARTAQLKPLSVFSQTKTGVDRIDGWMDGLGNGQTADQETHPGNRTNWWILSYQQLQGVQIGWSDNLLQ